MVAQPPAHPIVSSSGTPVVRLPPFVYIQEHRVPICVPCGYGVVPAEALRHLESAAQHADDGDEQKRDRPALVHQLARLPFVLQDQQALRDGFVFPDPTAGPIEWLAPPMERGLKCVDCGYITLNDRKMKEHMKDDHGWVNPISRNRAQDPSCPTSPRQRPEPGTNPYPWRTHVHCQRFFAKQHASRWFEVDCPTAPAAGGNPPSAVEQQQQQQLRHHIEAYAAAREEARRDHQASGRWPGLRVGPDFESAWVRHMRWSVHFDRINLTVAYAATLAPLPPVQIATLSGPDKEFQQRLRRLVCACKGSLDYGYSLVHGAPVDTLRQLASIHAGQTLRPPFGVPSDETQRTYHGVFSRFLCYCLRMHRLGRQDATKLHRAMFTDGQWDALGDLDAAIDVDPVSNCDFDDGSTFLEGYILSFMTACLFQKVAGHVYVNPVLHFCAVIAIDPNTGNSFLGPENYTNKLAAILKCARVFAVAHAASAPAAPSRPGLLLPDVVDPPSSQPDPEVVPSQTRLRNAADDHTRVTLRDNDRMLAFAERFHDIWRTYLVEGSHSVFSCIVSWMQYGKAYRANTPGAPSIIWLADRRSFALHGDTLRLCDIKMACRHALEETCRLAGSLCHRPWSDIESTLDLHRLHDDLNPKRPGWSFLKLPDNAWLKSDASQIADAGRLAFWPRGASPSQPPNPRAARLWLAQADDLRRMLLLAVHLWAGQPGRGPEIMSLRYKQGTSLPRNVFVFDGQIMLLTDRDKAAAVRNGLGRKIARFLPRALGQALVAYLAWVLPFESYLTWTLTPPDDRIDGTKPGQTRTEGWLWSSPTDPDDHWDTDRLTRQMKPLMERFTGSSRINTQGWRHVAVTLGREIAGLHVRYGTPEDQHRPDHDLDPALDGDGHEAAAGSAPRDDIWDLQATHGTAIANQHYAVDAAFPFLLTAAKVYSFRAVSTLWHGYLLDDPDSVAASSRPTDGVPAAASRLASYVVPDSAACSAFSSSPVPLVAATSAATKPSALPSSATANPALPSFASPSSAAAKSVSQPSDVDKPSSKRRRSVSDSPEPRSRPAVPRRPRYPSASSSPVAASPAAPVPTTDRPGDVDAALQTLLRSPTATWRSPEQRAAALAVLELQGSQSLITVLPTGSGKSMLFFVPAHLEPGLTQIVVVPFAALIKDLFSRALAARVRAFHWQTSATTGHQEAAPVVPLVLVSADVVLSDEFTAYVDVLREAHQLGRIFVDECHTALMDNHFRIKLGRLRELHRFRCPLVLLTATMPPPLLQDFRRLMLVEDAQLIRAATVKKNARYQVIRVGSSEIIDRAVAEVHKLDSALHFEQKGVVYCRSIDVAEKVAQRLSIPAYHSKMDRATRDQVFREWIDGVQSWDMRWLAATTSLGTGIDVAGVAAVVHVEAAYGIIDYAQQVGRGARHDDEEVTALTVASTATPWTDRTRPECVQFCASGMNDFVSTSGCRRAVLASCMDGDPVTCEQAGGLLCDNCQAALPGPVIPYTPHDTMYYDSPSRLRGSASPSCITIPSSTYTATNLNTPRHGHTISSPGSRSVASSSPVRPPRPFASFVPASRLPAAVSSPSSATTGSHRTSSSTNYPSSTASSSSAGARGENRAQHAQRSRAKREASLQQWLRDIESGCAVCHLFQQLHLTTPGVEPGQLDPDHSPARCQVGNLDDFFRDFKNLLRFKAYTCCFRCGLPDSWCGKRENNQKQCRYIDQVLRVLYAVHQHVPSILTDQFGPPLSDPKSFRLWLGRPSSLPSGLQWTNALVAWEFLVLDYPSSNHHHP